jgi:hypothetical protein
MTFRLTDLLPPDGSSVIEGKTFEDCVVWGPAVVIAKNLSMHESRIAAGQQSGMDGIFVPTVKRAKVFLGMVVLKDCVFRRCTIAAISFNGSDEECKQWRRTWFTAPPAPAKPPTPPPTA